MKTFFTFLVIVITSGLIAQPILQPANIAQPGFSATLNVGVGVSSGSSGANQTWNFSTAIVSPAGSFNVLNSSSTPCTANFPTSGWCFSTPGSQYAYYNLSSSLLEETGASIPSNCSGGSTFSNPKTVLIFPFNYTNTNTDAYVSNTGSGNYTVTYDAYGTLITPFGTYLNVARITNVDGTNTSTVWLNTNPIYQIMTIDENNNTIIFSNASVGVNETQLSNLISVFPNPSNGNFTISTQNILSGGELEIYNCLGEIISKTKINELFLSIDLSEETAGIYFYHVISQGENISSGKLIIQ